MQTDLRVQTVSIFVLAAVAMGFALYWLRPVMIPFVLAIFITLALTALIEFQHERLRFPRPLAALLTFLLAAIAAGLLVSVLTASVNQLAANADAYQAQVQQMLERAATRMEFQTKWITSEDLLQRVSEIATGAAGRLLGQTTNAVLTLMSQSVLVLIFVMYLMLGRRGGRRPKGVLAEIEVRVTRYLVTKLVVSAATGFLVGFILSLLHVPLAMVFGLLAFLLNFIPNIGSIIATLMPLPVVLVSAQVTPLAAVLAIAVPGAIQFTVGNILEPKIMGDTLNLSPIVVLLTLIFWGMLWGIVGALLATPITAALAIVLDRIELTRPVAALLEGRIEAFTDG